MFQDRDKTRALIDLFQNGEKEEAQEALREIIQSNDGLVKKLVKKYQSYAGYEDLLQEGYIGLIRSAMDFDLNRNTEFSTYAMIWIEQYLRRFIPKTTLLHFSNYVYEKYIKLVQLEREIDAKQRDPMTDKEKMVELSIKPEVYYALQNGISPVSLNRRLNEDEDGNTELGDMLAAPGNVEEEVIAQESKRKLLCLLKEKLSTYEYDVLARHYGLEDVERQSLREIARVYQVSAERIRQVEERAMKKLKLPHVLRKIREVTGAFDYV